MTRTLSPSGTTMMADPHKRRRYNPPEPEQTPAPELPPDTEPDAPDNAPESAPMPDPEPDEVPEADSAPALDIPHKPVPTARPMSRKKSKSGGKTKVSTS